TKGCLIANFATVPIKKRFSDEEISLLMEMEWWNWPLDKIKTAMPLLCSSNIFGLHKYWREFAV
ncbi:hypothetical protein AB7325_004297, partial [Acinetobacter baumannii]